MTNRERFEAAAADGYFFERDSEGNYEDRGTAAAWDGFSLALANDPRRSEVELQTVLAVLILSHDKAAEAGREVASCTAKKLADVLAWVLGQNEIGNAAHNALDASLSIGNNALQDKTAAT